uniref:Uncharacterized protein n=1 Tax=Populus alba TaxID=43335 RepID=A0A4V6A8Q5_POPAL|nr:hypothetical protein D5086_0000148210 [Populus alba]
MDSINLGEVLSPNAWTTDVVSSVSALADDGQFVGRFVDEAYHHCCYPVMVALVEPLQFCLPCEMYGISGAARLSAWSGAILHLWGLSAWLVWPPLMLVGLAALSFRLAALGTGLSSSVLLVLLVLQACLALSQSSTYAGMFWLAVIIQVEADGDFLLLPSTCLVGIH